MWQELLARLNPSISDLFIVLMGMGVLLVVIELRRQIKDLRYKYNVLNTAVFAMDKVHKTRILKTGNSQGDFMLDWDAIPTLQEKVNES